MSFDAVRAREIADHSSPGSYVMANLLGMIEEKARQGEYSMVLPKEFANKIIFLKNLGFEIEHTVDEDGEFIATIHWKEAY